MTTRLRQFHPGTSRFDIISRIAPPSVVIRTIVGTGAFSDNNAVVGVSCCPRAHPFVLHPTLELNELEQRCALQCCDSRRLVWPIISHTHTHAYTHVVEKYAWVALSVCSCAAVLIRARLRIETHVCLQFLAVRLWDSLRGLVCVVLVSVCHYWAYVFIPIDNSLAYNSCSVHVILLVGYGALMLLLLR